MKILPRSFYERDTVIVARNLLGKLLVRHIGGETIISIIAETEAYRSDDPACHSFKRNTPATAPLFGPVGHTYVYRCHAHFCFNIIGRDTQHFPSGGVLIRALIPLSGFESIKKRLSKFQEGDVIKGPGNLTKAVGITKEHVNIDVVKKDSEIVVAQGIEVPDEEVIISTRVGIRVAQDKPWRFYIKGESCKKILALKIV